MELKQVKISFNSIVYEAFEQEEKYSNY